MFSKNCFAFFLISNLLNFCAGVPARITEKVLKFIRDEVEKLVPNILSNLTIDEILYDKDQTHALLGDVQITDFRPPTQIQITKATEDRIVAAIKDLDFKFKVNLLKFNFRNFRSPKESTVEKSLNRPRVSHRLIKD